MATQQRLRPRRGSSSTRMVVAGAVTALALLVLDVTAAAVALLLVGAGTGAVVLLRERRPHELIRFCAGTLVGLTLYVVLAWYGAATAVPGQVTSFG